MGTDIQPYLLLDGGDPQTDTPVQQLGYYIGGSETKDNGDDHSYKLDTHLSGISEKQTVGAIAIHGNRGKQTGGEHAPGTGDAVTGPDIQRFIQFTSVSKTHGII